MIEISLARLSGCATSNILGS